MKAVLRGRITVLNVYIETFEKSQISNLIMYIKNLEKQEQYPSPGGEKLDRINSLLEKEILKGGFSTVKVRDIHQVYSGVF